MTINLDPEQVQFLRETLEMTLTQLRLESARTDTHAFREMLHRRERTVEAIVKKLSIPPAVRAG